MWLYKKILRVSWTEHVSDEEALSKMEKKMRLIHRIRKGQLQFLGKRLRKESFENLTLKGHTERQRGCSV